MSLDPYLAWEAVPLYVVAATYVALGLCLAAVARRAAWLWAFACYCIFLGGGFISTAVWDFGPDAATRTAGARIDQASLVAAFPALVTFTLLYPQPRLTARRRRFAIGLAIAFSAVVIVLGLVPGLEPYLEDAAGVHLRPLFVAGNLVLAMTAVAAFVFSRDLRGKRPAHEHRSIWLVVLGFCVYPIFRGVRAAYLLATGESAATGAAWSYLAETLQLAVTPLALLAAWRLAKDTKDRKAAWGIGVVVVIAVVLGLLTARDIVARAVTVGIVPLVLPVVVAYALLRLRFARLDGGVRWTLSKGTVAAIIVLVFIVGSQVIQNLTQSRFGAGMGGALAAGGALFAVHPIGRLADRFANAAIPVVAVAATTGHARNVAGDEAAYRAAVRKFLADGTLSRDDERHLARLTTSLGIDASRAFDLREAVEAEMAQGPSRLPKPKQSRPKGK